MSEPTFPWPMDADLKRFEGIETAASRDDSMGTFILYVLARLRRAERERDLYLRGWQAAGDENKDEWQKVHRELRALRGKGDEVDKGIKI